MGLRDLYDRHVLPRITETFCGSNPVTRQREKILPLARGTVLEVGFGTGLNLAHYDPARVDELVALEPSRAMAERAEERLGTAPFPVRLLRGPGEHVPLPDASVDTVVTTYTLCSVDDVDATVREMRRVLRPGGQLLFVEHGLAPDARIRRWQTRATPVWRHIAGGCRLDVPVVDRLEAAGFHVDRVETMYLPGTVRPLGFNYWGVATPS